MIPRTCGDPKMSPTWRAGAASNEGAEHKSDLPYLAVQRLKYVSTALIVTRLVPRLGMKTRFRFRHSAHGTKPEVKIG